VVPAVAAKVTVLCTSSPRTTSSFETMSVRAFTAPPV
jgi:hypothetical protein